MPGVRFTTAANTLSRDGKTRRFGFTADRAAELLAKHGSLDAILRYDPLLPSKEFDRLQATKPLIPTMRQVVELRSDVPLPILDDDPLHAHVRNLRIPGMRQKAA